MGFGGSRKHVGLLPTRQRRNVDCIAMDSRFRGNDGGGESGDRIADAGRRMRQGGGEMRGVGGEEN